MKPLYLHGKEALQVDLDGPALRVRSINQRSSERRFPLSRVSRVVVSGAVSWCTEALMACAAEGIVVCFLDQRGRPAARWFGRPSPRTCFVQRWRDFLDRPDCAARYRQWRSDIRLRAIRFCALRVGTPVEHPRDAARKLLTAGPFDVRDLIELKRILYGAAYARALEELAQAGFGADDASDLQIAPDLAMVVQWGLHPDLLIWGRNRFIAGSDVAEQAIGFFEQNQGGCRFHLRETLRHLNRYLCELH